MQYVCSLAWQLRTLFNYDRVLCAAVLGAFAGELARSYERRAKRELGLSPASRFQERSATKSGVLGGGQIYFITLDHLYGVPREGGTPERFVGVQRGLRTRGAVSRLCAGR